MWQSPNQRIRAIANARRRSKERPRFPVHFKRVNAELEILHDPQQQATPSESKIAIRIVLNDLSNKGLSLFSSEPIASQQLVAITTEDPSKITIKGKVIYCQEHNANSHVITSVHFGYRIGIEFTTEDVNEKVAIQQYVDDVAKNYLSSKPA